MFLLCSSPGLRQKQASRGGYTNEVIITPPLLTVNMRTIQEHGNGVNVNRFKCHRTGKVFRTYRLLKKHRVEEFPLDYVYGKPFFMCEVSFTNDEEFVMRCTDYFEGFQNDEEE